MHNKNTLIAPIATLLFLFFHNYTHTLFEKTNQITFIEPCKKEEIVTFFQLISLNQETLKQNASIKKAKNGNLKLTLTTNSNDPCACETLYYLSHNDHSLHEHKDTTYGSKTYLYKGNLHNDGKTTYILITRYSGSGNYGRIVGAWSITETNTLIRHNQFDNFPWSIDPFSDPFIVIYNNNTYLQFTSWEIDQKLNSPHKTIVTYFWKDNTCTFYKELSTSAEISFDDFISN